GLAEAVEASPIDDRLEVADQRGAGRRRLEEPGDGTQLLKKARVLEDQVRRVGVDLDLLEEAVLGQGLGGGVLQLVGPLEYGAEKLDDIGREPTARRGQARELVEQRPEGRGIDRAVLDRDVDVTERRLLAAELAHLGESVLQLGQDLGRDRLALGEL